jgi:hypothetical protein
MGLLFILQIIYERGEPWWNDIDRGRPNNLEKNLTINLTLGQSTESNLWTALQMFIYSIRIFFSLYPHIVMIYIA